MSAVPLTQAVTSGDAAAVNAVLANGADVNERTGGGQTPLILATIFGHTHLITLLLEAGADPHLRDNLGLDAVDWAHRRGATEVIEVLSGTISEPSRTAFEPRAPKFPAPKVASPKLPARSPSPERSPTPKADKSVSEEERSRRWIAGLKQRIAEQSQPETPDGSNIFRARPSLRAESPPTPEIPTAPKPEPEIPAQPEPQPEIPPRPPDPQPEIPTPSPEPEVPTPLEPTTPPTEPVISSRPSERKTSSRPIDLNLRVSQPEPQSPPPTDLPQANETTPAGPSTRKRCPQCNAIYNSELVAYCSYHAVPLIDVDAPVISEPPKSSPAMFWIMIAVTLVGSIIIGSLITAYFFNSQQQEPQQAAQPTPTPIAVQKGTPALDRELDGKSVWLPVAECPLNGQEAIPGTVTVEVKIDRTGKVKDAQASGGDWLLRDAAKEAAMKSTFSPAMLRGRESEGTITYTFEP